MGYAAVLDEVKLLYQLDDLAPRYISLSSRQDVPLSARHRSALHDATLEEASRRAGALLKVRQAQARGEVR